MSRVIKNYNIRIVVFVSAFIFLAVLSGQVSVDAIFIVGFVGCGTNELFCFLDSRLQNV
jgi:hypothetical protein